MNWRRNLYILLFFGGGTLFTFSLLPFFREFNDTFYIATIVGMIVCVVSAVGIFHKPRERVKLNSRYERKTALVTAKEKELLATLRQIDPDRYEVLPQIALVSVIDKKTNTSYRNELFRVCDYCFVDRRSFEPLLLVELNDSSHKRADRRDRDEKVNAICRDAGLPVVTFWTDAPLDPQTVKKAVKKSILK